MQASLKCQTGLPAEKQVHDCGLIETILILGQLLYINGILSKVA